MTRTRRGMPAEPASTADVATVQTTAAVAPAAPRKTRVVLMRDMLERPEGARLEEICTITGWQAHSVRAALSGLRKGGAAIERITASESDGGGSVYRIQPGKEAAE